MKRQAIYSEEASDTDALQKPKVAVVAGSAACRAVATRRRVIQISTSNLPTKHTKQTKEEPTGQAECLLNFGVFSCVWWAKYRT